MPTIEVNGTTVSYLETGGADGGRRETVVLLHSSACSGAQWRGFAERYGETFRLIAPDLHGYGATAPWRGGERLRLADEAAIVAALTAACDDAVHLVGHSYGGAVALQLASAQPARVRSLTLIEPVSFHLLWNSDPRAVKFFDEVRALADDVTAAVERGEHEAAMRRFVDYWNGEGAWAGMDGRQRQAVLRAAPKIPMDFWAAITEPTLLEDYAALARPTLILRGDRSPAPVRRIADLLAGALPQVRTEILHGAGHMLPLTHRHIVNPIVAQQVRSAAGHERRAA